MLRVGQRYIAWCAFERAAELEGRFSASAELRRAFTDHCRRRQQLIENLLPADERPPLRPRFEEELAHGRRYQQAYQDHEAARIAAGVPLDDPHFYDAFHAEHGPIASPLGSSDKYFAAEEHSEWPHVPVAAMVFFAGLCAFVTSCLLRPRTDKGTPAVPAADSAR
jgi:hypothetical protein